MLKNERRDKLLETSEIAPITLYCYKLVFIKLKEDMNCAFNISFILNICRIYIIFSKKHKGKFK